MAAELGSTARAHRLFSNVATCCAPAVIRTASASQGDLGYGPPDQDGRNCMQYHFLRSAPDRDLAARKNSFSMIHDLPPATIESGQADLRQ